MKNQKGITLIALVITIIVLLILAGVSIAMLSGDNGILTQASSAASKSGEKNLEEALKLTVAEILLNDTTPGVFTLSALTEEKIEAHNSDLKDKVEVTQPTGSVTYAVVTDGTTTFHVDAKGNITTPEA